MEIYFIESPHTKEECLAAIEGVAKEGEEVLSKFAWGCNSGDHTGYALVDVKDESEAQKLVPEIVRSKARLTKLDKLTIEQIKAYH